MYSWIIFDAIILKKLTAYLGYFECMTLVNMGKKQYMYMSLKVSFNDTYYILAISFIIIFIYVAFREIVPLNSQAMKMYI